jgi:hypothetical protein
MPAPQLPPCGLYRTTTAIGEVPAGRLVYFHNHGDPGPGVYLPKKWVDNQATFESKGHTLPEPVEHFAASLEALPDEGFYRVTKEFFCCEKKCRSFEADLLVQLGYNSSAQAILFVPGLSAGGIAVPDTGSVIEPTDFRYLAPLKVGDPEDEQESADDDNGVPPGATIH